MSDSERRYATSYAAGMTAASGEPFPPPLESIDRRTFVNILPTYAVNEAGEKLSGESLDAWIRRSAEAYRRSTAHRPGPEAGYDVRRWAAWLKGIGMRAPYVKTWFFSEDVLKVYGEIYAQSKRGYGSFVPSAQDPEEAAQVAQELASKVVAFGEAEKLPLADLHKLATENMILWSKQYLRIDGYGGGKQYVEQKHRFANLRRNLESYGMTWKVPKNPPQAVGGHASQRAPPVASSLQGAGDGHATPLRDSGIKVV